MGKEDSAIKDLKTRSWFLLFFCITLMVFGILIYFKPNPLSQANTEAMPDEQQVAVMPDKATILSSLGYQEECTQIKTINRTVYELNATQVCYNTACRDEQACNHYFQDSPSCHYYDRCKSFCNNIVNISNPEIQANISICTKYVLVRYP